MKKEVNPILRLMLQSVARPLKIISWLDCKRVKSFPSKTLLHTCIKKEFIAFVKLALIAGIYDVETRETFRGETPIYEAIRLGNLDLVKFFVAEGANINLSGFYIPPLLCAAEEGYLPIVEYFVQQGVDVNFYMDIFCKTALFCAIEGGNLNIVAYLVEQGASIHYRNRSADTPLSYAMRCGHSEIANYLKVVEQKEEELTICTRELVKSCGNAKKAKKALSKIKKLMLDDKVPMYAKQSCIKTICKKVPTKELSDLLEAVIPRCNSDERNTVLSLCMEKTLYEEKELVRRWLLNDSKGEKTSFEKILDFAKKNKRKRLFRGLVNSSIFVDDQAKLPRELAAKIVGFLGVKEIAKKKIIM